MCVSNFVTVMLVIAVVFLASTESSQDGLLKKSGGMKLNVVESIKNPLSSRVDGIVSLERRKAIRMRRDTEGGESGGNENPWEDGNSGTYAIMWAIIGSTIGVALLVILSVTIYSYKNNETASERKLERRRRRLYEEMARNRLDTSFYEDVSSNFN
ncbi:uncharacterized protein LOC144452276 [Glandiceps talaboti]